MKLNKDQQQIFNAIFKSIMMHKKEGYFGSNYMMITGAAGTGKSTLAAEIIRYFTHNDILRNDIQCTALTHKALNELRKKMDEIGIDENDLNGISTIHSYMGIKPVINPKTGKEEFKAEYNSKQKKCSILIIDEVSMMDNELFKIVQNGTQLFDEIILIGDEFQVPPVNNTEMKLFKDPNIQKFELTEVTRQAKGNPIIQLSQEIVHKIRNKDYKNVNFCIDKIKEYSKHDQIEIHDKAGFLDNYADYVKNDHGKFLPDSKFTDAMITTFTNDAVNYYNYIAKCIYKQSNNINYIDVGDILVPQNPVFHPYNGDDIIAMNNAEIYVHELEEITYEGIPCFKVFFGESFMRVVKPDSIDIYDTKLEEIKYLALNAEPKQKGAYWQQFYAFKNKFAVVKQIFACTLHKAQGSTVDRVFIDLNNMPWRRDPDLAFRLTYVGITRSADKCICKF